MQSPETVGPPGDGHGSSEAGWSSTACWISWLTAERSAEGVVSWWMVARFYVRRCADCMAEGEMVKEAGALL